MTNEQALQQLYAGSRAAQLKADNDSLRTRNASIETRLAALETK